LASAARMFLYKQTHSADGLPVFLEMND
jgi:hypothetical protein